MVSAFYALHIWFFVLSCPSPSHAWKFGWNVSILWRLFRWLQADTTIQSVIPLQFKNSFSIYKFFYIVARYLYLSFLQRGFPDKPVGKESACNARSLGSIPGSGISAGEGIAYPLQYSWASLVAQVVKNLPAVWETWAWSLDWDDPLEEGKATHSRILAWRMPWTV